MATNNPVGLSLASHSKKAIKLIEDALENDTLKLRPTADLIGVQICGSVKNIIAVAAGVLLWLSVCKKLELRRPWGVVMLLSYAAYFVYLIL